MMKIRVLTAVILAALIGYLDATTSCYSCLGSDLSDPLSCTDENFDPSETATDNCEGSCYKSVTKVDGVVTTLLRGCKPLSVFSSITYTDGCEAGICTYYCDPKENDKCNGGGFGGNLNATTKDSTTSCYSCAGSSLLDPLSCTDEKFDPSKTATDNCEGSCFKSVTKVGGEVTIGRGCNPSLSDSIGGFNITYTDGCTTGICTYYCDPKENDKCNGGGFVHASAILTATMIALIVAIFG